MATYYIGANDEHGQNPFTAGKRTPTMPYLNRPFYENEFNRPAKNRFLEACLRCGFAVYDVKPELTDTSISTRVTRINRQNLTLLVTFGYNAFGSGNSFNSARGISSFYSTRNVKARQSRALAEELYEQLVNGTNQVGRGVSALTDVGVLESVNCTSALVEPGFMTNLAEAKMMIDPDYQTEVGEECCRGVCEFLGERYVTRELANYPTIRYGAKGNFVYLLQFMLRQNGYNITVDGIFGNGTLTALVDFQNKNGLTSDGVAGQNTWRTLLVLPPRPTLRVGSRGTYVRYLQEKLTSKLYPLGTIDGIFGNGTKNAVVEFQQENGLSADGIVGPRTWNAVSVIGGGRS
ncbi:MAG: peptidoglycan-binding protein [Corallococcus sp.]|nr:peptidoglycan-binding protein [Corallococcus sp.]MCM1358982.1 peptidoglycan-binding protein [Corallococcus sp.]MCM1394971.1 peptidoglycan-binding protein [Corallococcus sp.]